jgi:dihydroceramide fatty acyl 2-hydroxylase
MATAEEMRAREMARALRIRRVNAVTAALSGGALIAASARLFGGGEFTLLGLLAGLLAGLLYANLFEYVLHRFFLHRGGGFLVQRHALHHDSAGTPQEARYVNFASSPWAVVLVFALNSPAVFLLEGLLHAGLAAGMFAGFTAYYVVYEDVHWRIHFGGLPRWMAFARRHHMLHHGDFPGRNNVFLPICDWLFDRRLWKQQAAPRNAHPAGRA